MKQRLRNLPVCVFALIVCNAFGAIRYVDVNSANPSVPYTDWQTAAARIQDAVDVSTAGDEIIVTNGLYSSGGRPVFNSMTNRVAVDKAVLVRSVNGPQFTLIQGFQVPGPTNGNAAIRCVYLTDGARLVGFTLTNGATHNIGDFSREKSGGGVWSEPLGVVSNCVFIRNQAAYGGGGAYGGLLYNCLITQNATTNFGGGVSSNTLYNCTVSRNSGIYGGGAGPSVLNNCIVYFNSGLFGSNYYNSTLNYSCTTPQPASGNGNIIVDPLFVDLIGGNLHLASNSPCINAGNNVYAPPGADLDGNPRILDAIVDIGAYEFPGSNAPVAPYIINQPTNQTVLAGSNATFSVLAGGTAPLLYQWSSNGVTFVGQTNASLTVSNVQPGQSGSYYSVSITNIASWAVSTNAYLTVTTNPPPGPTLRYVSPFSAAPAAPYTSWATAATNIQDAVDASINGDEIVVTNGVYASGGRAGGGATLNRVSADRAVKIYSLNGPQLTIIQGRTANQGGPMRCAYLTNGASLSGFTLTNGEAGSGGIQSLDQSGGGVYCASSAIVSNCIITGNYAHWDGGGAYNGILNRCILAGNSAYDGGGGASGSKLNNCLIISNTASGGSGGGVFAGGLTNCTIVGNSAFADGGTSFSTMFNCISYFNSGANYHETSSQTLNYCCTTPQPVYGTGNITNQPLFLALPAGNFRLQPGSPGIDAGNNTAAPAMPDLDGNPRISNAIVDMGAYEFQGTNAPVGPYITSQPTNQTANVGATASFVVGAGGTGPLSYEWYFQGTNLVGTAGMLTLTNVQGSQAGNYFARITNAVGAVTSSVAVLTVVGSNVPPLIVLQPTSQSVYAGTNVTFRVTASGTQPLIYRWLFNGAPIGAPISGGLTNVLIVTNVQPSNAGNYSVVITNAFGMAISSNALLTILTVPPYINSQPTNQTVSLGANVTFYVTAGGTPPLVYRWRFNGVNIENATSNSLTLLNVQSSNAGNYSVVITNSGGFIISSNALLTVLGPAVTHYVDASSSAPTPPYTNWATAASTIQDAVDIAAVGDDILVTNGVYSSGGRAVAGTMTNRVAVTKPLLVHSVNGAQVTLIQGYQVPGIINGDGAVRCVYLTNGAALAGFTVTNGATRSNSFYSEVSGGGVLAESISAIISNCIITGNAAWQHGGGAYSGSFADCSFVNNSVGMLGFGYGGGAAYANLHRCVLIGNQASQGGGGGYEANLDNCLVVSNSCAPPNYGNGGGGAQSGTLKNCTIVGNAGGGVYSWYYGHGGLQTTLKNCILYYNSDGDDPGNVASSFDYSCTSLPRFGNGNITNEPVFIDLLAGNFRLESNSPCINAGNNTNAVGSIDLDGNPRIFGGTVDMGVYEFQAVPANRTHYVDANSPSPSPPYTSWDTAATTIQDAVDVAKAGDEIVVTNGFYASGGRAVYNGFTNRVAVTNAVTLRSVNGPQFTTISGGHAVGATNGPEAIRCVLLTSGGSLCGFTLTNGATLSGLASTNDYDHQQSGGGVWCGGPGAVVSNCVLIANSAFYSGGGAYLGTFYNCTFSGNQAGPNFQFSAQGGGADGALLINCTLTGNWALFGGGAASGTLINCTLRDNLAGYGGAVSYAYLTNCVLATNHTGRIWSYYGGAGGGAYQSTLNNCLLIGNSAGEPGDATGGHGGAADYSTLRDCTVAGNTAVSFAGGCNVSTLFNCIAYYNSAPFQSNHWNSTLNYTCTSPFPTNGIGNIVSPPLFVDLTAGNLRLLSNSPCINAGNNADAAGSTDLDGRPRIVGGTVDMGAYEFDPSVSPLFLAWLQQNGLPTNGSADNSDPDGDGLTNSQEYQAGTNPYLWDNLRLEVSAYYPEDGVQLTAHGQVGTSYALEATTDFSSWTPIACISCTSSNASYFDTSVQTYARRFYRLAPLSTIPPPVLGMRVVHSAGNDSIELRLQGVVGFNYQVEASVDLLHWEPVGQMLCTNKVMYVPAADTSNYSQRFYRARMK